MRNTGRNTGSNTGNHAGQVADIYPLSPTQQGMLFHSLYEPQTGVYVVQVGCTLKGAIDTAALKQAWQQLSDRHPILRTAFVWDNLESPVQVVGHRATVPFRYLDWSSDEPPFEAPPSAEQQQQRLSDWMSADRAQGFDLSTAPLMRLALIRLDPDRHRMVWSYHHLLLDGWSVPMVLQELLADYRAIVTGVTPGLPQRRPYRDYIAWLQKQDTQDSTAFWQEQLSGLTTPTSLGIDRITPNIELHQQVSQRFAEAVVQLSTQLTQQLKTFGQSHRLTLNTLVQGAWAYILGRYSGGAEVVFGAAYGGRPVDLAGSEAMVGLLINSLPQRVKVVRSQSLLPWLQQLQAQQQAQQVYAHTPLVEIQGCSGIPRSSPLFESLVVFENYPAEAALMQARGVLQIEEVTTAEQTHYPLNLFAALTAPVSGAIAGTDKAVDESTDTASVQLSLKLLYACDRFTAPKMQRLLGHLETVLGSFAVADAAEITLGQLPLLTPAEKQQIEQWNQTKVNFPNVCVPQLFEAQVAAHPDAVALVWGSESLSYAVLNQRVNQMTGYLRQNGVHVGTRVAVAMERSPNLLIALLAVLKAGGLYLPLDPATPAERLAAILREAQPHLLLQDRSPQSPERSAGLTQAPVRTLAIDTIQGQVAQQSSQNPLPQSQPEDLAYLIYTSGSTGQPKGVPIRHASLSNLLQSMAQAPGMTAKDVLLAVTTPAFDIAALELFLPLTVGGRLVMAPSDAVRDPHQLAQTLAEQAVTLMQATPATWRLLLNSGWSGGQTKLKILCGGEALDSVLAQQLLNRGREVWNLYGPTETTIWSGVLKLEASHLSGATVPLGRAIANTQFHVLDDQQQPLPIGVPGELYIGGAGLSPGYWQREAQTAESFVPVAELGLLYRTGDRVRYLEDGMLDYLDRLDDQIKLRGFRIERGEIEAALLAQSGIDQAAVQLDRQPQNPQQDPQLVAYFTGEKQDVAVLREALSERLPSYMIPQVFIPLETFPLTPNGKIDRKALPAPQQTYAERLGAIKALPQTQSEKTVARIWKTVLKLEQVGVHDNFFDLGGHSLLMVQVHAQIQEQFFSHSEQNETDETADLSSELAGISLVELFRYPTIHAIAQQLQQRKNQSQTEVPQLDRAAALRAGRQRLQQRRDRQPDLNLARSGGEA